MPRRLVDKRRCVKMACKLDLQVRSVHLSRTKVPRQTQKLDMLLGIGASLSQISLLLSKTAEFDCVDCEYSDRH